MARILLTSGPTREPIDPVRYLSNASSGRMGCAIAQAALSAGHQVDLVSGPVQLDPPSGASEYRVTTALEMLEVCERLHPQCDVLIGAAAVSDYRPRHRLDSKRSRDDSRWTIELEPNPDILATLGGRKGERVHVGFALESRDRGESEAGIERACAKIDRKNLDWCVLNFTTTIGADSGEFFLISSAGDVRELGDISKADLAVQLLGVVLPTT